ncbi:galactose oxidase [Shewanella sp. WXL01]|uniref:Kelch repeat-containing protein n=1 Tax=Shewanella sp. WXL01 TaxID=2709721 RepID=UPI0014383CEF|nr:kelch repeat-containing protein [Shewanella sp. WXL01]NKF51185.1 galactose oxidase [Shewanella sp. WXL01]
MRSFAITATLLSSAIALTLVTNAPHVHAAKGPNFANLPEAVANNGVAKVTTKDGSYLLSFTGLGSKRDYTAVHNRAWKLKLDDAAQRWQPITSVPFVAPLAGRLASTAIGIKDKAYFFGGYTVAKNHEEISTVDNYRYDVSSDTYQRIADMPVAVDDSTPAVYQQRYVYLFGGWHNDGNVNLVQVYDTQTDTWQQASPMPAPAVFGQAAGIVGEHLVVCDGVKVKANLLKRRNYQASPVCLYGKINPQNHLRISWQLLPHFSEQLDKTKQVDRTEQLDKTAQLDKSEHASKANHKATAYYRMAATGIKNQRQGIITFIGGSDNPYNYEGIGYNGEPSEPSPWQHKFDIQTKQWLKPTKVEQASMDHRGLICHQNQLLRIGGMLANQTVSNLVLTTKLDVNESCI